MGRFTRLLRGRRPRWDENWAAFPGEVAGRPALWFVDMGAVEAAPAAGLPYRLDASAEYPADEASGLPDGEALAGIYAVEEALTAAVTGLGGAFIGRVTSAGLCRLTAHLPEAPANPPALAGAAVTVEYDPHWAYVRDTLAPDARQAHLLGDLAVVRALAENGDQHEQPREVEFFAYFAKQEPAEAAAAELRAAGHQAATEPDDEGEYSLRAVVVAAVAPPALHEVTWSVRETVERHGGNYDGWGCLIAP